MSAASFSDYSLSGTDRNGSVSGNDASITVKVGDTVLYSKYGGTELKLEGKDYLMMRESDILAIV